jgi:diketogulonate reductase-like aldo/keto reductase
MQQRQFGPLADLVSAIGQGTWQIETSQRTAVIATLRRGLDLGLSHIDTAELYGSGFSETIIGEAIEGRRDEVFLVSKVKPNNASRHGTIAACEASLKRLKTDRLDCFLLHWPGSYPLEDTIASFEELQQAGKIRSWGVSNFDIDDLEAALAIAGPGRIACDQVLYYLGERGVEHEVIPWCAEHGVAVVAYSPFGQHRFPDSDPTLTAIATAHHATPRQVALAFLTRKTSVFAIPKASTLPHVEENAGTVSLTEADLARIDAAFPLGPPPRVLPTL